MLAVPGIPRSSWLIGVGNIGTVAVGRRMGDCERTATGRGNPPGISHPSNHLIVSYYKVELPSKK